MAPARDTMMQQLEADPAFDVAIIGGGATGLGAAVDAAARGYRTVLLERGDFGCGTSSRSTKLVHGGVRYLAQGNLSLVREALLERGRLLANAPDLVRAQQFVVPTFSTLGTLYYLAGLKAYDLLAGRLGIQSTQRLGRKAAVEALPTIRTDRLAGGVVYCDGQFDDARLAVRLAQVAAGQGAVALNYMNVTALDRANGHVTGLVACDVETGREWRLRAKCVINATGVFADQVRRMDQADAEPTLMPSRGSHLVLDRRFLPGDAAMMIPKTDDGRVLFAIPWEGRVLLGTTDVATQTVDIEPRVSDEEIDYLLEHAGRYLTPMPQRRDVLSMFAGLRPLARPSGGKRDTAAVSRDHAIHIAPSGLVTVTGGKWTTYRRMAEDAINAAAKSAGLPQARCGTRDLPLAFTTSVVAQADEATMHEGLPVQPSDVVRAVRDEGARTLEDVLSRRTRCLLLDARAAVAVARQVARIMAGELGRDEAWREKQIAAFSALAADYLPG
jgi:glycerol-3-phosphate dehydrogenase